MDDQIFYDIVARELQDKKLDPGLWTRAYAEGLGDNDKARAIYILYRVGQLKKEANANVESERPEPNKQQMDFSGIILMFVVICGIGLAVYFWLHRNDVQNNLVH